MIVKTVSSIVGLLIEYIIGPYNCVQYWMWSTLEENLSTTTICCDLAIATRDEKMHK